MGGRGMFVGERGGELSDVVVAALVVLWMERCFYEGRTRVAVGVRERL